MNSLSPTRADFNVSYPTADLLQKNRPILSVITPEDSALVPDMQVEIHGKPLSLRKRIKVARDAADKRRSESGDRQFLRSVWSDHLGRHVLELAHA